MSGNMNGIQPNHNNNMYKEFFRFAVPSVTGMVVTSLYTIIDGIFVGRGVGELALGSVNLVYPFIMLQIAVAMLFAFGGANHYSMRKGRGEHASANNVFCQSIAVLAVFAFALNMFVILLPDQTAYLLGADEKLAPGVKDYIFWVALFGIVYMPGVGVSIFVRNDNAPGLEMVGTLSGAIANIILDYLFIIEFGWGIAGAAIATGIGQMIAVTIYMSHFLRRNCTLRLRIPRFIFSDMLKVSYNGFATFLMEFSQSAIAFSFNLVLMAKLGPLGVASYSIVMYICSIFNMVLIGVVQGAQPIISFNHGQGNVGNENKIYRLAVGSNLTLTILFYGLVFIFCKPLTELFITGNTQVTETAVEMMCLYFLGFFPIGISLMNILYFQTTEQEGKSVFISVIRCLGFVQLFLVFLPGMIGIVGIYLSFLCGELCNCGVSSLLHIGVKEKAPVPVADT